MAMDMLATNVRQLGPTYSSTEINLKKLYWHQIKYCARVQINNFLYDKELFELLFNKTEVISI